MTLPKVSLERKKEIMTYISINLFVILYIFRKFGMSYTSVIKIIVICFASLFVCNYKFIKVNALDAFKAYSLFITGQIVLTCILSDTVEKGLATLLIMNALSPLTHWLIHTERYANFILPLKSFHDNIHHLTNESHKVTNIIIEGIWNIVSMSFLWFPPFWFYGDKLTILSYGLLYSSYHLINQRLLKSPQHEYHHNDKFTNFGPDYIDVLYNTKGDNKPESLNTGIINIVIILGIMYSLKKLVKDPIYLKLGIPILIIICIIVIQTRFYK